MNSRSGSPRTGKRGDRQAAAVASHKGQKSSHQDALHAQDSKTVRQRVSEAKRSGFLDLSNLNLSLLPEDAWDLTNLHALLLGHNQFTQVPPNLANVFPHLQYLDMNHNEVTSIPSILADMESLLVLDFSQNEGLAGSQVPSAFGPIRHKVAVFIDDESVEFVEPGSVRRVRGGSEEVESDDNERDDDDAYDANASHDETTHDDDEDETSSHDSSFQHSRSVHKRHDLLEDVALKLRKFMKMVRDLEDVAELEGQFQRLLAAKDPVFVKYLSKRYHQNEDMNTTDDDSASESVSETREARRLQRDMDSFERKEKEKHVKGSRNAGRKLKHSMLAVE
ncbi:hypothetical protein HDU98_007722 [Podochytrium sp. JEL0797]|nr:hypothetical protein HDU98_007722 [Podochytrium sp. JEL0797]